MSYIKARHIIKNSMSGKLEPIIKNVNIRKQIISESVSILEKISPLNLEGKKPNTIAGACIFLSGILISYPIHKREIANMLGISDKSIYTVAKIIRKFIDKQNNNEKDSFMLFL